MARYVVDAPTLLHLIDGGLRADPAHQLVAPNSIRSECLRLLLRDVRAGRRTEPGALEMHERLTEMKLRLLGDRVSRVTAWRIARERDWDNLRDAEYLAITRLQADALVTVDRASAKRAAEVVRSPGSTRCSSPAIDGGRATRTQRPRIRSCEGFV